MTRKIAFVSVLLFTMIAAIKGVAAQTLKDLKITEIKIKPAIPKVGEQVVISYQVQNAGSEPIPQQAYSVSLKIDGELVSFDDDTPAIPVGQSVSYSKAEGSYHKMIEKKGVCRWEIKIKSRFKDANPKDNVKKGTIVVN